MKRVLLYIATSIVMAGFVKEVSAESYMYKWKSSDGEVHYSERPPAPGVSFEKIKVTDKERKQAARETAAPAPKAEIQQDDSYSGWRKENCSIALKNLDILQNASRIAQDDGQGGTRLMTEEEKQEKIKKMVEQKNKYCPEDTK